MWQTFYVFLSWMCLLTQGWEPSKHSHILTSSAPEDLHTPIELRTPHDVTGKWMPEPSSNQELQPAVLSRQKRYLIYPDGDPARVQLIIGVGLPVDLEDQSVTMGYVIKLLYHIPQNSTDYTTTFLGSSSQVRRQRSLKNVHHIKHQEQTMNIRGMNILNKSEKEKNKINENVEPTDREDTRDFEGVRNFTRVHSEGGGVVEQKGVEKKYETLNYKEENKRKEEKRTPFTNRWDIYKILEHMMEHNGMTGRACMLRTICEAAETPFTFRNGLLGELVHIIFTPSTSTDLLSHHTDNEYHAAEKLGASQETDCETLFPECEQSFLELFSQVDFVNMFG